MIIAHRIFRDATDIYFAIKVNGEWTGTVVITQANRNAYSYTCYSQDMTKGMPLNISWLKAIKNTAPNLVKD